MANKELTFEEVQALLAGRLLSHVTPPKAVKPKKPWVPRYDRCVLCHYIGPCMKSADPLPGQRRGDLLCSHCWTKRSAVTNKGDS